MLQLFTGLASWLDTKLRSPALHLSVPGKHFGILGFLVSLHAVAGRSTGLIFGKGETWQPECLQSVVQQKMPMPILE